MKVRQRRIGIYSGTFDPIHAGHIAFAMQAVQAAKLDRLYILPEREPRHKSGVVHFGHRTAMISRALRPHPHLDLFETIDRRFTIARTLPRLEKEFPGAQLVFVCGADTLTGMGNWPHIESLLKKCELCVGLRSNDMRPAVLTILNELPVPPVKTYVLESLQPDVSSSAIRRRYGKYKDKRRIKGLLASVAAYIRKEWLYLTD